MLDIKKTINLIIKNSEEKKISIEESFNEFKKLIEHQFRLDSIKNDRLEPEIRKIAIKVIDKLKNDKQFESFSFKAPQSCLDCLNSVIEIADNKYGNLLSELIIKCDRISTIDLIENEILATENKTIKDRLDSYTIMLYVDSIVYAITEKGLSQLHSLTEKDFNTIFVKTISVLMHEFDHIIKDFTTTLEELEKDYEKNPDLSDAEREAHFQEFITLFQHNKGKDILDSSDDFNILKEKIVHTHAWKQAIQPLLYIPYNVDYFNFKLNNLIDDYKKGDFLIKNKEPFIESVGNNTHYLTQYELSSTEDIINKLIGFDNIIADYQLGDKFDIKTDE